MLRHKQYCLRWRLVQTYGLFVQLIIHLKYWLKFTVVEIDELHMQWMVLILFIVSEPLYEYAGSLLT